MTVTTIALQPGKFYRMRDGGKAKVCDVRTGTFGQPVIGWIDEVSGAESWDLCGYWLHPKDPSPRDLIAEWMEPRSGEVWVNVYTHPNGGIFGHTHATKADAELFASKEGRLSRIKCKWTEGRFDD